MEGKLRALRGGRANGASPPDEARMIMTARAKKLEALGVRLLDKARRRPIRNTKSNGVQVSAELSAALRLFEAADKIWARLQRADGKSSGGGTPRKSKWDGLL